MIVMVNLEFLQPRRVTPPVDLRLSDDDRQARTFGLVFPLSGALLSYVGFPWWPKSTSLEHLGWERDRVLSVAKGTASSAAGFLAALVVALLKDGINAEVPGAAVLGCLLGAVGLLMFAAQMSMSVRVTTAVGITKR